MSDYTPEALEKVREAEKRVSTRAEVQENFNLVFQQHGDFEGLISPAPLSIALLGQLILLSLETDFSLDLKKASQPPKLLNYPGSLRASLLQVSHAGWDAFNLAHKNMDQIRLLTASVPTHVNKSVKIIVGGTRDEIQVVLPKALKNIKRIATDCTTKARDTEHQFVDVINLISELLELCTARRGEHEQEMKENKAARDAAEFRRTQVEKEQKAAEEELEEMKKHFKDCRKEYKETLDEVPSGKTLFSMVLMKQVATGIIDTIQMVSNPMQKIPTLTHAVVGTAKIVKDTLTDKDQHQSMTTASIEALQQPQPTEVRRITRHLIKLKEILELLQPFFNANKDRKTEHPNEGNIEFIKATALQLQNAMATQEESLLLKEVTSALSKTIDLIEKIAQHNGQFAQDPELLEVLKKEAMEIGNKVDNLYIQVAVQTASLPIQATPMIPKEPLASSTSKDEIQAAVAQSRMKFEQTAMVMRTALEKYQTANKKCQDANREMADLVTEIAMSDIKEIDFKTIRKTLLRGIKVLGQVREQWSKFVEYFQKMANIIELVLQESLTEFLEDAESGQELRGRSTLAAAMRDSIYVSASKANQIAYVVNGLSATYTEVSAKYIMPPLVKLDTYMALDADKDQGKIKDIQRQIDKDSKVASEAITALVQKRHVEILEKGYERLAEYEKTMEEALPPPSKEEESNIQKMREAAVKPLSEPVIGEDGW